MLVIMGDLMGIPVGTLFTGAIIPGLILSTLYVIFIAVICFIKPSLAPSVSGDKADGGEQLTASMIVKSFIPRLCSSCSF